MVDLEDINTKELIEFLNRIEFSQEKISEILNDNDPEYTEYKKAFFSNALLQQISFYSTYGKWLDEKNN